MMNRRRWRAWGLVVLLVGLAVGVGGAAGAVAPGALAPDDAAANAGWEEIGVGSASGGGISNNDGSSRIPSIVMGPDGPIVAWYDDSDGDNEIYVRRWNGSAWVEMGAGSASGGGISNNDITSGSPALAVGPDGPVIAWDEFDGANFEIYLKRWNGSAWVALDGSVGSVSNNDSWSAGPAVAFAAGAPIVAWHDNGSGNWEIYVRRWNGSAWVEMGAGSASSGGISNNFGDSGGPQIAVGPDGPIVAWVDRSNGDPEIYVRRWNGSAWVQMGANSAFDGGISNSDGWADNPTLAIGLDGPIVAWQDDSNIDQNIYVRRWNGAAWVEMGAGSASGGGISGNGDWTEHPTLAVGPEGPIVAWQGDNAGDGEIYVRRWNGSAWVEVGTGSAAGGGVSDNDGFSFYPAVAIGPDSPIVAWSDDSGGDEEIYVRRAPVACYSLALSHSGNGSDPTTDPDNSAGCIANEYTAGQQITLSANPADGWRVAGWTGTNNDPSTAKTNTLTMPDRDHSVTVIYEQLLTTNHFAYIPHISDIPYVPPPCFPGPNEVEDNDNDGTANGPLCAPGAYFGLPDDTYDFFKFDTTISGRIAIEVSDIHVTGMQLALYYQFGSGQSLAFDTEQDDGLSVEMFNAQPGRYFIRLYTNAAQSAATQPYTMQVTYP